MLLLGVGVLVAFAQPPEPDIEMGRVGLFMANLTGFLALFRDLRKTGREGATRAFTPTPARLAVSGLIISAAAAACSLQAESTGYGLIYFGFFLTGVAFAGQRLVLLRPLRPDA